MKESILSEQKAKDINTYQRGDSLSFGKDFPKQGIIKDEIYRVNTVNTKNNEITLIGKDAQELSFNLIYARKVTKHWESKLELSKNDKVVFTKDMPKFGVKKGDKAYIENITTKNAAIVLNNGEVQLLKHDEPIYMKYDYSTNIKELAMNQKIKEKQVMIDLPSGDSYLLNKALNLSKECENVQVCTKDINALPDQISKGYQKINSLKFYHDKNIEAEIHHDKKDFQKEANFLS